MKTSASLILIVGFLFQTATHADAQLDDFCARSRARLQKIEETKAKEQKSQKLLRYSGCRPLRNDWRTDLAKSVCSAEASNEKPALENVPNLQLVFFDGFGDFSIEQALDKKASNWSEQEISLHPNGRGNGLQLLGPLMNTPLNSETKANNQKIQLHYYAGSAMSSSVGRKAAASCQKELELDYQFIERAFKKPRPRLVVVGYSNGATEAMKFANLLAKDELPIDKLISIDPIPQKFGFFFDRSDDDEMNFNRSPYVIQHVNLFQQTDEGSLSIARLRGRSVSAADRNVLITPPPRELWVPAYQTIFDSHQMNREASKEYQDMTYNYHTYLPYDIRVQQFVTCEVKTASLVGCNFKSFEEDFNHLLSYQIQ